VEEKKRVGSGTRAVFYVARATRINREEVLPSETITAEI
jgi:hypothetical protein